LPRLVDLASQRVPRRLKSYLNPMGIARTSLSADRAVRPTIIDRARSDADGAKAGDVVLVIILGHDREVTGDRRRRNPGVADRHAFARIAQGNAKGGPRVGDVPVDR